MEPTRFFAIRSKSGKWLSFNRDLGDYWTPTLTVAVVPFPTEGAANAARLTLGTPGLSIAPVTMALGGKPATRPPSLAPGHAFRTYWNAATLAWEIYQDAEDTDGKQPMRYIGAVGPRVPIAALVLGLRLEAAGAPIPSGPSSVLRAFNSWRARPEIGRACVFHGDF